MTPGSSLLDRLLGIVAPQRCACCARYGAAVCVDCAREISRARLVVSRLLGIRLHALGAHTGALRRAVLSAKFARRERVARALGALAWRRLGVVVDALVPVPLHPLRQRERGYNQALAIAQGYGRAVGLQVVSDAVERRANTSPQSELPRAARMRNIGDAFAPGVGARRVDGLRIAIVDDVVTTGTTVLACARALQPYGPASIAVIALSVA